MSSQNQDIYLNGDNNSIVISGVVRNVFISGNNNTVDLEDISISIACNGSQNTILLPEKNGIEVVDTGENNRLHFREFPRIN